MHQPKKNCPFHGSSHPCRRDCISPHGNHCTLDFTNPAVKPSSLGEGEKKPQASKCPYSHLFEKVQDKDKVTAEQTEETEKRG